MIVKIIIIIISFTYDLIVEQEYRISELIINTAEGFTEYCICYPSAVLWNNDDEDNNNHEDYNDDGDDDYENSMQKDILDV